MFRESDPLNAIPSTKCHVSLDVEAKRSQEGGKQRTYPQITQITQISFFLNGVRLSPPAKNLRNL
jgi:hypothetical protein